MIRYASALFIILLPAVVSAQGFIGFRFGQATSTELSTKVYPADTSASAYVISEFGESEISQSNVWMLIFKYHVKIKILRKEGLRHADIRILLRKTPREEETISDIRASSFNRGSIEQSKLESKSIFTEKNDEAYDVVKFAIPGAKVGSVIEYQYEVRSPFLWNFREWEFQSDIPKVQSEYNTTIPSVYFYNTTLRGNLNLAARESTTHRDCFPVGVAIADCAIEKYVMRDIPAFKMEEYMTARSNFISAIRYEIRQFNNPSGNVVKFTKEWKDADLELKDNPDFGLQLTRGKDVIDEQVDALAQGEQDSLTRAEKIHAFVRSHYTWDGSYGALCHVGLKKAFEQRKGSICDINLTLVAALRYAGFKADPVLIATRGVGRPTELHPVLSDFNYVIAKLHVGGKMYLVDAVDDFLPFGSIPIECYNDIGRVIDPIGSYSMDIKPTDKDRELTMITLKLLDDGKMTGIISHSYSGYAALRKRKQMARFPDEKSYLDELRASNHFFTIASYERTGENDLSKPLSEKLGIEFAPIDQGSDHFLFSPFLVGRTETNPFKSDKRMYPVDFAVPQERSITVIIEFPSTYEITSMPDKIGLTLPNNGGKYIFGPSVSGNRLTVINNLSISRPVFAPEEYPYLKEVYGKMVQAQGADVIFQKKK